MTEWKLPDDDNMVALPPDVNVSDFEPEVKAKKKGGRVGRPPNPKPYAPPPHVPKIPPHEREELGAGTRGPLKGSMGLLAREVTITRKQFLLFAAITAGVVVTSQIVQTLVLLLFLH